MKNNIQNNNLTLKASLAAIILCILFGGNAVAVKISFQGIGPLTDTGLRFFLAALAILIWTLATGRSLKITKKERSPIFFITLTFIVQMSLFHFGLSKTAASRASLIINLQPFLLLIFAHFFIPGDRITLKKTVGLLAGFSGLLFVFTDKTSISSSIQSGDILVFSSTMIWALVTIYIKRIIHTLEPYKYVFYQMAFALPFFFIEGFLLDKDMIFKINYEIISALIYQSLVTAAFGFIAWSYLLKRYGVVALHIFIFIMPITGIFFSSLLLNETISHNLIIALLLIVLGICIIHIKAAKLSIFPFRRSGFE